MSSRETIGAVDWHLLLLFACLFGVTAAFAKTGLAQEGLDWLAAQGLLPDRLVVMAPLTLAASNTIGNVPAVILSSSCSPICRTARSPGWRCCRPSPATCFSPARSATSSSPSAPRQPAPLSFADFARSGIPMTLASLAVTVAWLWATGLVAF